MTDKLHCPFCGMELKTDVNLLGYSTKYWYCENTSCAHLKDSMREDVWQALIDGKKAQDALNWLNEYLTEDKVEENVAVSCQYLKAKITSMPKQGE